MAWVQPKMDWTSQDYFNLTDWNRIVGNGLYLYDLVGASFEWRNVSLGSTADLPYYNIVNDLESNLLDVGLAVDLNSGKFNPVEWFPRQSESYKRNPSFNDFNRWESFEYNLNYWYTRYSNQLCNLKAGTFTAGNNRLRQYLARG